MRKQERNTIRQSRARKMVSRLLSGAVMSVVIGIAVLPGLEFPGMMAYVEANEQSESISDNNNNDNGNNIGDNTVVPDYTPTVNRTSDRLINDDDRGTLMLTCSIICRVWKCVTSWIRR